ncbi:hypothetical protein Tco_0092746 [Tanacetum coccineum]
MSSASSAVTYTSVYTDSKPGRAFWGAHDEEVSEGGITRVILLGYDRLPMQPVAPPSPDYIPGPKDPQTPPVPQDEDKREPMFVQAHDPDYVSEPIYPEYIPLEDEHEFPAEEQPLPPVIYLLLSHPELVIPPPSTDITIGARITVRPQTSISLPPEAEVERLLAITTPSPSPPISLSPPSAGERLARCMALPAHSPPLLPSSRISSTQALIDAVTVALPSPPLPSLPPSLYIPPPIDRKDGILESEQPPRKREFMDFQHDLTEQFPEIAPMTVGEVNTRVTELAELHEHNTQDLYALLEDAQDSRSRISQQVDLDSQRVDLLMRDMMTLPETIWMVEEEAYASREAWAHLIGLSQAIHQELQTHRDHVRQDQMIETLRFIKDMRREMSGNAGPSVSTARAVEES